MKIRLNVSDERYAELEQKLLSAGFEIDDEAELIITEKERYSSFIAVKNKKGEKNLTLYPDRLRRHKSDRR